MTWRRQPGWWCREFERDPRHHPTLCRARSRMALWRGGHGRRRDWEETGPCLSGVATCPLCGASVFFNFQFLCISCLTCRFFFFCADGVPRTAAGPHLWDTGVCSKNSKTFSFFLFSCFPFFFFLSVVSLFPCLLVPLFPLLLLFSLFSSFLHLPLCFLFSLFSLFPVSLLFVFLSVFLPFFSLSSLFSVLSSLLFLSFSLSLFLSFSLSLFFSFSLGCFNSNLPALLCRSPFEVANVWVTETVFLGAMVVPGARSHASR